MKSYITRREIREINRKLFAHDIISSDYSESYIDEIISGIIQRYNPEDKIASVPTVLHLDKTSIHDKLLDKLSILNKDSVIIEINNSILAEHHLADIVRELSKQEYKLIISINKSDTIFSLLNSFANYISFDIEDLPDVILSRSSDVDSSIERIAYNVNTPEDYALAESVGIKIYSGDYVGETKKVELETNDHSKVNFIEIISLINNDNSSVKDISKIIGRDSLMSAQIIRLSNSSYFGNLGKRIDSIEMAITRIGLKNLKSWIFLIQFNNGDAPEDLLQTSYHRAVFCERLMKTYRNKELSTGDAYLIGLFSTVDVLTGKSMEDEIPRLNLSMIIEDALVYREGLGGTLLNLVKAYDEANFRRIEKYSEQFKADNNTLNKLYFESLDEVTKLWRSMTELGDVR